MLEKIDNMKDKYKITDKDYKDLVEELAKLELAKRDIDVDNVKYVRVKMNKMDIRCCTDCDSEVMRVEKVSNVFKVADDALGTLRGSNLLDFEDAIRREELRELIKHMERKWGWYVRDEPSLQYLIYDIVVIEEL